MRLWAYVPRGTSILEIHTSKLPIVREMNGYGLSAAKEENDFEWIDTEDRVFLDDSGGDAQRVEVRGFERLDDLIDEYRETMDLEVLHNWAKYLVYELKRLR